MKALTVFLTLTFFALGANAGKYYKWTDDQGVTHYTARAPDDRAVQTIKIQTGETQSQSGQPTPDAKTDNPEQQGEQKTKLPESAPATPQQLAKAREQDKKNCTNARNNLDTLNSRTHVRINDKETGDDRYLTPDEHAAMKKETELRIKEYCK